MKVKFKKNNIKGFLKWLLMTFLIVVIAACNEISDIPKETNSPSIVVEAQLSQTSISRSYQDSGTVEMGTYSLTYTNQNNSYALANVNFGIEGTTPSIGIVSLPSEDNDKAFTWDKIGGGSSPTFYLDNIPIDKSISTDPTIVKFTDSYNPFIAGVFDTENGENDLLWGIKTDNRNVSTLNFDLHHNMARLQVIVTVDKSNSADAESLNLENATVTISNLILTPESYNRLDGSLTLPDKYETFTLVSKDNNLEWADIAEEDTTPDITIYNTCDFVLPPQNLLENTSRPRLTITLENGKVYSGVIPYAMIVIDSTYPEPGYPMTLSLMKEHLLTIRTIVTEEPPELSFMPVYVVEWVDKGNFFLDGHQAGIYTADEFYSMIKHYNSDETTRNYQLQRYGTLTENTWDFVLWNSLHLDYSQIVGEMSNGPSFNFSFSGFGVYIINNNESKQVTENELLQIVRGTLMWNDIP